MSDLFDLAEGRALRDAGTASVTANAGGFMDKALDEIAALPSGEYRGENIRAHCLCRGIAPHHPNAWGALIATAAKRGLLKPTGRYVAAASKKSHASVQQVYQK